MIRPVSDPRAWLPRWRLSPGGVVAPDERLPAAQTLVLGLQRRLLSGDGGDYGVKDGAAPLPPLP